MHIFAISYCIIMKNIAFSAHFRPFFTYPYKRRIVFFFFGYPKDETQARKGSIAIVVAAHIELISF